MIYFHLGIDNGAPIDYGARDSAVAVAPEKSKRRNLLCLIGCNIHHKCVTKGYTVVLKSHSKFIYLSKVLHKRHTIENS